MNRYVVVYLVHGTHYRYRCQAKSSRDAKKLCCENMGCTPKEIVESFLEDHFDGLIG